MHHTTPNFIVQIMSLIVPSVACQMRWEVVSALAFRSESYP